MFFSGLSGLLSVQDANWLVEGEENYAWFGFSLASCQLENVTLLLIGSPTWKTCSRCVACDSLLSSPLCSTSARFKIYNRLDLQFFRKSPFCSAYNIFIRLIFLCLQPSL